MVFQKKRGPVSGTVLPERESSKAVKLVEYTNTGFEPTDDDRRQQQSNVRPDNPAGDKSAATLPINTTGLFSYILITWFSPLIWRMYRKRNKPVRQSDLWDCSKEEGVRENTDRIKHLWMEDMAKYGPKKASFFRVWVKFVWVRTLQGLGVATICAFASVLSSAVLVNLILTYLESDEDNMVYGMGLTVAVLLSEIARTCSVSTISIYGLQTGTRFRSGMNGLLYDKLLRLKSLNGKRSEILNIFGADSYRVFMTTYYIIYLVSLPIYLVIFAVFCYYLIGFWFIISTATFVVLYLLQMSRTKVLQQLRKKSVKYTDARVRFMSEILSSMKFIKLYAWEQPFKNVVEAERQKEQKYLLGSALTEVIAGSILPIAPTIASVVTISLYTAAGNDLKASTAFAVLGTMNFMRQITAILPYAMRLFGEAKVSLERVKSILLMEEYTQPSDKCLDEVNAVEMKEAGFSWGLEPNAKNQRKDDVTNSDLAGEFALKEITMDVKTKILSECQTDWILMRRRVTRRLIWIQTVCKSNNNGQCIGICGAVGSGKSSLMNAILGRMQHLNGHLAVKGRVAYVGQQAWIFNGSVKENILFGLEYEEKRYNEVIRCCGLEPDLQIFTQGDETEIGEHGINISGGQKQRVDLARAAYSNSDIYILDDPMSALDTNVGKHVFHSCIRGLLQDKTVLLVTHQLQYMAYCDDVLVLEKGNIVERGHHEELLTRDGIYSEMYHTHESTTMKSEQQNESGTGEESLLPKEQVPSDKICYTTNGTTEPTKDVKDKGKLVQAEDSALGTVSVSTYNSFIKAAGGWGLAVIAFSMHLCGAASLVFSDWWLSQWIRSTSITDDGAELQYDQGNRTDRSIAHNVTKTKVMPNDGTGVLPALGDSTFYLVYIISLAGIILLQVIKGCLGAKLSIKASNKLHSKCLDGVLKAPMLFFESNPAGRILNRFTKDLDEGDVYIPLYINVILQHLCLAILTLVASSYITPWILIAAGPVVVFSIVMKQMLAVTVRQMKRLENVARSPLISHVNLTSQGLPNIVTYGQQKSFYERCVMHGDVASMMSLLFEVSTRWIGIRLDLLGGLLTVSAFLIFVLSKGTIHPTSAGLVLSLIGKTVIILQFLMIFLNEMEGRFTSIERIHEYGKSLQPERQHGRTPPVSVWPTEGAVEFRNVVMRYRQDLEIVLRRVSFVIRPREKVGVVGRTGAGKTSLAVCLFRLVELSEGTILVDGEDVSKLSLNCLRSRVSSIPQDPVLFIGTIRYNIDPFSKYTDDEIWRALEKVNMKRKILQFDDSLNVKVEENGNNFSVGERQLICLARAVLRGNKILLLDEATANIDTSTDAMIQETIRTSFADCTVITIAHRLNTVLHSDKIIVMDAGQVVEYASPERLLSDPYSRLNKMLVAQTTKL